MDPAHRAHIYVRGRCSTTAVLNNFLNRSQPVLAIFRIAFYNLIFLICVTTIRWNYLVHVGYETSLSHNSRPRLWILHMGFTFMWEGGVVHNPYQGYVKWLKFRKQADRLSRKKGGLGRDFRSDSAIWQWWSEYGGVSFNTIFPFDGVVMY